MAVTSTKKIHECNSCELTFDRLSQLNIHVTSAHDQFKNFKCKKTKKSSECDYDKCGKSFSHPSALKVHIDSVHKKIKKFKCESCDRNFSQFGILKTHSKKIHNKIINRTSYECDTCKENFETQSILKSHVTKNHDRFKNFKCDTCEKHFSQSTDLSLHISSFHSETIEVESENKLPRSPRRMRILKTKKEFDPVGHSEEISEEEREDKGKYLIFKKIILFRKTENIFES